MDGNECRRVHIGDNLWVQPAVCVCVLAHAWVIKWGKQGIQALEIQRDVSDWLEQWMGGGGEVLCFPAGFTIWVWLHHAISILKRPPSHSTKLYLFLIQVALLLAGLLILRQIQTQKQTLLSVEGIDFPAASLFCFGVHIQWLSYEALTSQIFMPVCSPSFDRCEFWWFVMILPYSLVSFSLSSFGVACFFIQSLGGVHRHVALVSSV